MRSSRENSVQILIVLLILTGVGIRIFAYGDFRLSVATADTASYIMSARRPLTENTLTGPRLLSTNIIFKVTSAARCEPPPFSNPAVGAEMPRQLQLCFEKIALLQNILSLLAWSILALTLAGRLNSRYAKVLAVAAIPAFGFSSTIGDWDSILGSESLTFSLFALALACVLEFSFQFNSAEKGFHSEYILAALTILSLALWGFTRDVNVYAVLLLLILTIPLFVFAELRRDRTLIATLLLLFLISLAGMRAASVSQRWRIPLTNAFNDYILPHPSRIEFMKSVGMPSPSSPEYDGWFAESAPSAYAKFLIHHPRFTAGKLMSDVDFLFSGNGQPYFNESGTAARDAMLAVSDLMHPRTHLILLLDGVLLLATLMIAINHKGRAALIWAWLGLWLFFSASVTLFISYFADSIGLTRHTLFSIELFRLMFWIILIVIVDRAVIRTQNAPAQIRL